MKINFSKQEQKDAIKGNLSKARAINAGAIEIFIDENQKDNVIIKKYQKKGIKITILNSATTTRDKVATK